MLYYTFYYINRLVLFGAFFATPPPFTYKVNHSAYSPGGDDDIQVAHLKICRSSLVEIERNALYKSGTAAAAAENVCHPEEIKYLSRHPAYRT